MLLAIIYTVFSSGCAINERNITEVPADSQYTFSRDISAVDYSGVVFTPWDVEAAAASFGEMEAKAYTIMIYMNGSDLESEGGAATSDLLEMLDSGVDASLVNIIIFTGGTYRWQNNVIPSNECMIWLLVNGQIQKIAGVGLLNMGDAGTLSGFIDFGLRCFPAEKYGLIFWDHGGGSIAGYGHDEIFNSSSLGLLEMEYAFITSGLSDNRLEFLGFDACLMATVEMAVVASGYAKYLVASEDVEPGNGWNYKFLSVLNSDPEISGDALGAAIADYYMSYYGWNTDSGLTLSVVDLSAADRVMGAMGALMDRCTESLLENRQASFTALAIRRNRTKAFGGGSGRDNDCDMVDIGDMANRLSDLFPDEAAALQSALKYSVVYNRHNSLTNLGGLAAYYIFGSKYDAKNTLGTYASLGMSSGYTQYLLAFADIITGEGIQSGKRNFRSFSNDGSLNLDGTDGLLDVQLTVWKPVPGEQGLYYMTGMRSAGSNTDGDLTTEYGGLWPVINGVYVCLEKIDDSRAGTLYAVPVRINGRDADLIISVSEKYPDGKILGSRQEEGYIIQKGLDKIVEGDKISYYYRTRNFEDGEDGKTGWYVSEEFSVKDGLKLEWLALSSGQTCCFLLTDAQLNEHYIDLHEKAA